MGRLQKDGKGHATIDYNGLAKATYKTLGPPRTLQPPKLREAKVLRMPDRRVSTQRAYAYIVCKTDGKFALLGPYDSEDEAYSMGVSKLHTPFQVVNFYTRDRAEATRRLRHILVDETGDLGVALRRMKHQV